MRNQRVKNKNFTRRALITGVGKLALFSALISRFGYLQIMNNAKYKIMAEQNSIKIIIIPPLRGLLLDRNGVVIADNRQSYDLVLLSQYIKDSKSIIAHADEILGYETTISRSGLNRVIKAAGKNNHIVIQENLSWSDIVKLEVQTDLSGMEIVKNQKRRYVLCDRMAHITGYTSKPTIEEIARAEIPHYQHFLIGKSGVEQFLNKALLGGPGAKKIEVNANGKFVRELAYKHPSAGITTKLSIDLKLQDIIAENLQGISGSVVVIKVDTGEVLAMHSTPSYDPNRFVGGVHPEYWNELKSNEGKPLVNKAVSNHYPPGSVFKIVTALAALASGIDVNKKILCKGEHQFGSRVVRCWRELGHGYVDLRAAIYKSCNIYFCNIGLTVGVDKISEIALALGFNQKTGIELPFENPGLLPTKAWIKKKLSNMWSYGDTINSAIGQGYVLVTPIQMATALARIASGKFILPTLLYGIKDAGSISNLDINANHLQTVRDGLCDVFNNQQGTGYSNRIAGEQYYLSGKTGTAQVIAQNSRKQELRYMVRDHGIFAGYLSSYNGGPLYSIAVVAEHGGWGSSSALPIAVKSFKEYIKKI